MSNIAKQDQFKIAGYTFKPQEAKIIRANETPTVQDTPPLDAKKQIAVAIIGAVNRLGHQAKTDNEVMTMATEIYNYAFNKYPTMKIQEVVLCIELGSFGEYTDDIVYISATNVVKWLKEYLTRKINVFKTLTTAKEKQRVRTAENEREEKVSEYWESFPAQMLDEFKFYKRNGRLSIAGWRLCKGLEETIGFKKHLDIEKATKILMYDELQTVVKAEMMNDLKKNYLTVGESMLNADSLHMETIRRCKQKCLMIYFDSLEDLDLAEFTLK